VQVPFDPAAHPRMHGVLLIAVFAFTLWVALAAAARRPGLAAAGLVVGAGWPGTLYPGHDLLRGALLLVGVLVSIACLRRGPVRGAGAALAAGALVLVAAVGASSSPALAKHAFLDWQRWDPYTRPAKPVNVSYVWDSSYDGLTFHGKPTTVLRIKSDSTARYWRATVLNAVVGGHWKQEFVPDFVQQGQPLGEGGLIPRRQLDRRLWISQIVKVEALSDRHLVAASAPANFSAASLGAVEYDATGIARAEDVPHRGDTYEVESYSPSPTPAQLARSRPNYPAAISQDDKYREVETHVYPKLFGVPNRKQELEFLFTKSVHADQLRPYRPLYLLAERVVGGAQSPYAAAVALERWFRVGGGFLYDQHPPHTPGVPPLVDFVTHTREGYCQHFAGAMALMLRYLGIPSRVAAGFTSGRFDRSSSEWVVSDRDAHAWVEVWFDGWGWLPFDPTPGRGGLSGPYSSSSASFDVAATAAVLRGAKGIRKFGGIADQLGFGGPGRVASEVSQLAAAPSITSSNRGSRAWGLLRLLVAVLAGLALLVITAKLAVRRSRYLTRDPRRLAAACRKELRDVLLDQQVEVAPSATVRELAALVDTEFGVDATAFGLHADAARFGPAGVAREAARATRGDLRRLRRSLRRELSRFERVRGLLSLRSLGFAG
jgi:transglutaminase-like putative cysteine protease